MSKVSATRKSRASAKKPRRPTKSAPSFSEQFDALSDQARRFARAGLTGLIVFAAAVGGVLWAGGYFGLISDGFGRWSARASAEAGFKVRKVVVRGRSEAAPGELLDALGPIIGSPILSLDLDSARVRIEEVGWVKAAAIRRLLPDTVQISVRERTPSAVWQMNGELRLVDDDGAIIRPIGVYEYSSLPLIVGAGAPDAAAEMLPLLTAEPAIKEMTAALVRVGERRWNLRLRNGIDVKLPDTDVKAAFTMLASLHSAQGLLDQPLEYIDLTDPERMVIRKRGEIAPTLEAQASR